MSYLSTALDELMKEAKMKNADLARASGIDKAKLSRWHRGDQTWIDDHDFAALAKALTNDPRKMAKLLLARMRDSGQGPGAEFIDLSLAGVTVREPVVAYTAKLPPHIEHAFALLRSYVMRDDDLREILIHLSSLLEEKPSRKKNK
jgi:transcriptional regulator with XRE-family HTH domain